MLEHLQTRRQILFDLTANYLEPLNGAFHRLVFLHSLRQPATGKYLHERLAEAYGVESVDDVVRQCHQEIFERLLEMPLDSQKNDLHRYLTSLPGSFEENVRRCSQTARTWVPPQAPSYLSELFCSNLNALLELFLDKKSTAPPGR
jgi:hypothetical protein